MDAAKMSRAQLAKFVAEGRKNKIDTQGWQRIKKSRAEVGRAGKTLQAIAKQNPQV